MRTYTSKLNTLETSRKEDLDKINTLEYLIEVYVSEYMCGSIRKANINLERAKEIYNEVKDNLVYSEPIMRGMLVKNGEYIFNNTNSEV